MNKTVQTPERMMNEQLIMHYLMNNPPYPVEKAIIKGYHDAEDRLLPHIDRLAAEAAALRDRVKVLEDHGNGKN